MPIEPVIAPVLVIRPPNFDTPLTKMPSPLAAKIVPALVMPPRKVEPVMEMPLPLAALSKLELSRSMPPVRLPLSTIEPKSVLSSKSAMPVAALMAPLPALTMSPVTSVPKSSMPYSPAASVPLLTRLPEPAELFSRKMAAALDADTVPVLMMPPRSVRRSTSSMPLPRSTIMPALVMPPTKSPWMA